VQDLKHSDSKTNVETVFSHLYDEIVSARLAPGTKLSASEIARCFGVSHQPVSEVFGRLENLDLLQIQPQKATLVKRFSATKMTSARVVRASVEANVLRYAAQCCNQEGIDRLQSSIFAQRIAVRNNDYEKFCSLDFEFHRELCTVGGVGFAFDVIAREKATVDRLCGLSKNREKRLQLLLDEHISITKAVIINDEDAAVRAGQLHLSHLDSVIADIRKEHAEYFDD